MKKEPVHDPERKTVCCKGVVKDPEWNSIVSETRFMVDRGHHDNHDARSMYPSGRLTSDGKDKVPGRNLQSMDTI